MRQKSGQSATGLFRGGHFATISSRHFPSLRNGSAHSRCDLARRTIGVSLKWGASGGLEAERQPLSGSKVSLCQTTGYSFNSNSKPVVSTLGVAAVISVFNHQQG